MPFTIFILSFFVRSIFWWVRNWEIQIGRCTSIPHVLMFTKLVAFLCALNDCMPGLGRQQNQREGEREWEREVKERTLFTTYIKYRKLNENCVRQSNSTNNSLNAFVLRPFFWWNVSFFSTFIHLFILLLEFQETRIKRKHRHLLISRSLARARTHSRDAVTAAAVPFWNATLSFLLLLLLLSSFDSHF